MLVTQDADHISTEIDHVAVKTGYALAKSYAANVSDKFEVVTFEQQRVAEYIFLRAAADMLQSFPALDDLERMDLRNRAIDAVKAAFETRLAELCAPPKTTLS